MGRASDFGGSGLEPINLSTFTKKQNFCLTFTGERHNNPVNASQEPESLPFSKRAKALPLVRSY